MYFNSEETICLVESALSASRFFPNKARRDEAIILNYRTG